mgnify:CR=1 FL=1
MVHMNSYGREKNPKLGMVLPKTICYKNRYWDPVVLDSIFKTFKGMTPNTPMEKGVKGSLDEMLKYLRDSEETADMYRKHIPEKYRNGKNRSMMTSLGIKWAKGCALHDILNEKWYDGDEGVDHIEETIDLLQNTISYNLPLLLKPIYDMNNPDSCFLTCMQLGAFNKMTRSMIEMGIPRETALFLFGSIFGGKDNAKGGNLEIEQMIRLAVKENYDVLPYWIKVQLEFLI